MLRWLYSTSAKNIGTLYLIFAVFAAMIGTAFSVLILMKLVYFAAEYWNSFTILGFLKEAQLSLLALVDNGVSLNLQSPHWVVVPVVFILHYLYTSYKEYCTFALSHTNNPVTKNLSVFVWLKDNMELLLWKLEKARLPYKFLLFVTGFFLYLYFTIEVAYAYSGEDVNYCTELQQSETEETVTKVGKELARKAMNSGISVQVGATAEDIQSAVQRLPSFNWWKEALYQGVITTGILTATSSVRGGPKTKIATFAGLLFVNALNQEGFIKHTASTITTAVYGQPKGNTAYNTNNSVSTINKVTQSNNPRYAPSTT